MTETIDLLTQIAEKCKGQVELTINEHRDYYRTVEEHIGDLFDMEAINKEDLPDDIKAEMIRKDTMIVLHFYPDSNVGFCSVYHHDLATALQAGADYFKPKKFIN